MLAQNPVTRDKMISESLAFPVYDKQVRKEDAQCAREKDKSS